MIKHIESLVARKDTVLICSVDESGYPVTKTVMSPRKRDGLKTMYFTTPKSTAVVGQYEINPKASVYFVDKSRFQSASFVGEMQIETDPSIIEEMWNTETARIFEDSFDFNNYVVLKFVAKSVKYMSNFETSILEI